MDEIKRIAFEALERYFQVIAKTGYMKDCDLFKLIYLCFIYEFLKEFNYYITDSDFRKIALTINCMADCSCLVDLIYINPIIWVNTHFEDAEDLAIRISEDEVDRFDLNALLRLGLL